MVEVELPVPNFQPPEIRRPCFFDRLERRRRVENDLEDSGSGSSETSRAAGRITTGFEDGIRLLECDDERDGGIGNLEGSKESAGEVDECGIDVNGNPDHPFPPQPVPCGAGYADTGRIFFCRFGVT